MEAVGITIGVPGLAVLFLQASLQGYEVLTNAKNATADASDQVHDLNVQRQRLMDWKTTYSRLLEDLDSTENERFLLIVKTLARIAYLFREVCETADNYSGSQARDRGDSQHISLPKGSKKHRYPSPSGWRFSRLIPRFVVSGDQGTPRQRSLSPAPLFDVEAIVPDNIKREELESLGNEARSGVSIHSLKWALRDKKKLEELVGRLKDYTQSLHHISKPLLSRAASSDSKIGECLFIVPFPRNPDYVERADIHRRLDELLLLNGTSQQRAALWALGGMGKTSVAAAYCYQRAESSISVFWVHGNSNETFQASYREICEHAKIKASDGDVDALQVAVKRWLESPESGQWLMVIDNLDDLEVESKYIPVRRGSILFTTRDRRILGEPRFAVPAGAGVEIEKMSFDEAASMCRNLGMSNSELSSGQAELLGLLGNLPLAIAQAAAYIRRTRTTTQEYLQLFKESESTQANLLGQPLYRVPKDDASASAVMHTWTVTINRIRTEDPSAVELLRFMSVMDPESISIELVQASPKLRGIDRVTLLNRVGPLLDFGLISKLDSPHYRMHRLVSLYTRLSIREEGMARVLADAAGSLLEIAPGDKEANPSSCSQLLPHATAVLSRYQENDTDVDEKRGLQMLIGSILYAQGSYDSALQWYQPVLDSYEHTLGESHSDTLAIVYEMASVFHKQGENDKALQWYQRTLDGYEKTLGKNHPETLAIINNVGSVFARQRDSDKALQWYQRALDGYEEALGKDHPNTLAAVNSVASMTYEQGESDEALHYYQRALDGYEQTLGDNHLFTLETVHQMASVFHKEGEYDKALEWFQRALDGYTQTLGENHPDALTVINNMAFALFRQGEYDEALKWFQRALSGSEQVQGRDHPYAVITINNVGLVFGAKGEYEEALQWYQRALNVCERALAKNHPDTLLTVGNIADLFDTLGEYDEALQLFQRASGGYKQTLGENNPYTLHFERRVRETSKKLRGSEA